VSSLPDISPSVLGTSVSLAASGLALISAWRAFRVGSERRFRGLDERAKAVAFWAAWAAAQKVVTPETQVAEPLARARAALDELAAFDETEGAAEFMLTVPASGLRRFLLLARPRRPGTWPLQSLFYLLAAIGVGLIVMAAADLGKTFTLAHVLTFAGVAVVIVLLLALLRQLVLLIDGKGPPPSGQAS
jgi:hypothetical protein